MQQMKGPARPAGCTFTLESEAGVFVCVVVVYLVWSWRALSFSSPATASFCS